MATQQERMHAMLEQQHQRLQELEIIKAKTDLRAETPLFDVKYRYAKPEETARIEAVLDTLPYKKPGAIDAAALRDAKQTPKPSYQGKAWLCFLSGSRALLHVYIRGRIDDMFRDLDTWTAISPALLLVLGDYRHLIYIDEKGQITEASITEEK